MRFWSCLPMGIWAAGARLILAELLRQLVGWLWLLKSLVWALSDFISVYHLCFPKRFSWEQKSSWALLFVMWCGIRMAEIKVVKMGTKGFKWIIFAPFKCIHPPYTRLTVLSQNCRVNSSHHSRKQVCSHPILFCPHLPYLTVLLKMAIVAFFLNAKYTKIQSHMRLLLLVPLYGY